MEFDAKTPIYYQIEQYINREIIIGHLRPGAQVPAVRQLAITLTVNVNTIQRALANLIGAGILVPERGKGNFVTTDQKVLGKMKQSMIEGEFKALYDHLAALELSPEEMTTAFAQYVQTQQGGETHE